MAQVNFEVIHRFDAGAAEVWRELVDWKGHEGWVPLTRVELGAGDPTEVGSVFTAYTGVGPLMLEDRMRVTACDWNDESSTGRGEVAKIGPLLGGRAEFTVRPDSGGSTVHWVEDVTVPYAPQFAAPLVAWAGAMGFRAALRRLAKQVRSAVR